MFFLGVTVSICTEEEISEEFFTILRDSLPSSELQKFWPPVVLKCKPDF